MNKKLLTIMISLLACSTLVVGCSKKQDKAPSSDEQQPSESSEPEPGPGPEPEPEPKEEIQIPKRIEEAKFLSFDEVLTLDYGDVDEYYNAIYFPGRGAYSDPEKAGIVAFETYGAVESYDFEYRSLSSDYDLWRLEGYNDDTYYEYYDEAEFYQYDGFDRVMSYRDQDEYLGLHDDEDNYYYIYGDYDSDQYFPEFYFNQDSSNYFYTQCENEMQNGFPSTELSHGTPNLLINDDYLVFVSEQLTVDPYTNATNYAGEYFNYLSIAREQIIYLFDRENNVPLAYYCYFEKTVDHDTYTGAALEEPFVSYRAIDVVTFEYGEMKDISEAETIAVPTEMPEQFINGSSVYIEAKMAAAVLNEDGELVAAPILGDSFAHYTPFYEFLSFDEMRLSLAPYANNAEYIALELGAISLEYFEPLGSDTTTLTYDLNQPSVYNKIVEVLNGQILEFEGQQYLIIDAADYISLGLIVSTTNSASELVKVVEGSPLAYFAY